MTKKLDKLLIKVILFDWHGVLDNVLLAGLFKKLTEESLVAGQEIKQRLGDSARQYTMGNLDSQEFWSKLQRNAEITDEQVEGLKKYINSIERNESLWSCLSKLKGKYRLGILSDCPMEKVEIIKRDMDLLMFEKTVFSAEKHMDKNMSEFFELAAKEFGVDKREMLFVDDSQRNIDFASKLGLQSCLFMGTDDFMSRV